MVVNKTQRIVKVMIVLTISAQSIAATPAAHHHMEEINTAIEVRKIWFTA